jgi:hypothetical protein
VAGNDLDRALDGDQVGLTVAPGWGSDTDEHDRCALHRLSWVDGERKVPPFRALSDQLMKSGLEEGDVSPGQDVDRLVLRIGSDHPMAHVRQGAGSGKADVPRADDPNLHGATG